MNELINTFLLAGDKFMPGMHLRQPVLVGHSLKIKKIKKIKETGDSKYIYQDELDKAYFQHDIAHADFKDLI